MCKIKQYLCWHNWLHWRFSKDVTIGTVYRCDKCGAFRSTGQREVEGK